MSTATPVGIKPAEMQLLTNFANTVTSREFNNNLKIQRLTLSYDSVEGYSIVLQETPNVTTSSPPPEELA